MSLWLNKFLKLVDVEKSFSGDVGGRGLRCDEHFEEMDVLFNWSKI